MNDPQWKIQEDWIRLLVVAARNIVRDAEAREQCPFCGENPLKHRIECLLLRLDYVLEPFHSVKPRGEKQLKKKDARTVEEKIKIADRRR